jgi:glycine betaine catabolism A
MEGMRHQDRPPLPAGTRTPTASAYTDPGRFARELDRIHGRMWLCAGRRDELPSTGAWFLRRVGTARVIVVRGDGDRIHAFHDSCRHRGTTLVEEDCGVFGRRIQCPYHGWTYGFDGGLLSAPHMEATAGFRLEDFPLRRVATGEWDGHIFFHLGGDPEPLAHHLADLPDRFRPWGMADLRRVERTVYDVAANWKLIVQNFSECLHCPIAHPQLQRYSHYLSGVNEPPRPTYLGGRMELEPGVCTLSSSGDAERPPLPGLSAEHLRQVHFYAVLPNLLLTLHPDYMLTCTLWPKAVDRTEIRCEWHFHADEIARPGFDPRGALEFWDLTNRQDWRLSERAQEGIASPGYLPGPYSNREEQLLALDLIVEERLREPPEPGPTRAT